MINEENGKYFRNISLGISDTRHLLWSILRKWRVLTLCLIFGGILGIVYFHYSPKLFPLSHNEIESLDTFIRLYPEYKRQVDFRRNDPFLTVPESNIYIGNVTYNVIVEEQSNNNIVFNQLKEITAKESFWDEISNILGYSDADIFYLKQVLRISVSKPESRELQVFYEPSISFQFSILSIGKDECEKAVDKLSVYFEKTLSNIEGVTNLSEISRGTDNNEVPSRIDSILNRYHSSEKRLLDLMNKTIDPRSSASILYINNIKLGNHQIQYIRQFIPNFEYSNNQLKYIFAGSLIGLIIGLMFVLIYSNVNPTISFWETICLYFGLPILVYQDTKKFFIIDSILYNLIHSKSEFANSLDYINVYLAKKEVGDLLICGNPNDALISKKKIELKKVLNNRAECIGLISSDSSALGLLSENSKMIFIFHIDNTSLVEAKHQILICKEFGIEILGVVLLHS